MDEDQEQSELPEVREAVEAAAADDANSTLAAPALFDQPRPGRVVLLALAFEGGLGLFALVVGWLIGHEVAIGMSLSAERTGEQLEAIGWGLVATLPLLVALGAMDRFPIGPIRGVKDVARDLIPRMFRGASVLHLAVVSLAAGFGEELLFRGLAQAGLAKLIGGTYGPWIALAAASALFGVCHWLNRTYAFLAMLAGVYFGGLLMLSGSLWAPIVAHAAYDFVALVYLLRPRNLIR